MRLTVIGEVPVSDMEKCLMTCTEDQRQLIPLNNVAITAKGTNLFAVLEEKARTNYHIEFNDSSE